MTLQGILIQNTTVMWERVRARMEPNTAQSVWKAMLGRSGIGTLCVFPSSFKAIGVPTGEVGWGREHQVREEAV